MKTLEGVPESILPNSHFSGFQFSLVSLSVCYILKKTQQLKNDLAYQQKTGKFFVYEEKKFGRIDCRNKIIYHYLWRSSRAQMKLEIKK